MSSIRPRDSSVEIPHREVHSVPSIQNDSSSFIRFLYRRDFIHRIPRPRRPACTGSVSDVCPLRAPDHHSGGVPTGVHLRQWRARSDVEYRLLPSGETGESGRDEGVDVWDCGQYLLSMRGLGLIRIDTGCGAGGFVRGLEVWRTGVWRMARKILDAFPGGLDGRAGGVESVDKKSTGLGR